MKALPKIREEQDRLRKEIAGYEQLLKEKVGYLNENIGTLAMNSVLPFNVGQMDRISKIFEQFNAFVFKALTKSVPEEKRHKYEQVLKGVEMAATGLAYRYLKRWIP